MSPALIKTILDQAPGISQEEDRYQVAEGHKASIYIAQSGQTTAISKVVSAKLHEGFIEIETEEGVFHYFDIEAVAGIAARPPREHEPHKTGFS